MQARLLNSIEDAIGSCSQLMEGRLYERNGCLIFVPHSLAPLVFVFTCVLLYVRIVAMLLQENVTAIPFQMVTLSISLTTSPLD